jgi:hypothetical protein
VATTGTSTVSGWGSIGINAVSTRGMPLPTASSQSVASVPGTCPALADSRTASSVYPASISTETGATG